MMTNDQELDERLHQLLTERADGVAATPDLAQVLADGGNQLPNGKRPRGLYLGTVAAAMLAVVAGLAMIGLTDDEDIEQTPLDVPTEEPDQVPADNSTTTTSSPPRPQETVPSTSTTTTTSPSTTADLSTTSSTAPEPSDSVSTTYGCASGNQPPNACDSTTVTTIDPASELCTRSTTVPECISVDSNLTTTPGSETTEAGGQSSGWTILNGQCVMISGDSPGATHTVLDPEGGGSCE